ncbi:MAG: hypothetical protein P1P86_08170 [Bacteroidales bacterium]|nr:hypothetical protein [Bacteroidales bacterium]
MKKTLAILALALFIGGIAAPAIASNNSNLILISLQDEDPKKKAKTEKSAEATKSADCSSETKSAGSDAKKSESTKKSDCSK